MEGIIPSAIIGYIILPYLIDDLALQEYLKIVPKKRTQYLLNVTRSLLGYSVTPKVAENFNRLDLSLDMKLIFAASKGSLLAVKYLISAKANIHQLALERATRNGNLPIVRYLIEAGAKNVQRALEWACEKGRLSIIQYLIKAKANIHAENDSVLIEAARGGRLSTVQYLIAQKADLHADNDRALQLASDEGHLSVVRYLIEEGANVHAACSNRERSFYY